MTGKSISALIVAAGRGSRAGGPIPKQWQPLHGRTVLEHTIDRFTHHPKIDHVLLVINPDDAPLLAQTAAGQTPWVGGADTRAGSVRAGLQALAKMTPRPGYVLIHDGARACTPAPVIDRVIAALQQSNAAAPGLPVTDALWRAQGGYVTGTQPREGLWRAQTPQGFELASILAAHDHPAAAKAADDVELALAAGLEVTLVDGHEENIKITHPEDFIRAERILTSWM